MDKFYIGESHNLEQRLYNHNSKHYDNAYTSFTDD